MNNHESFQMVSVSIGHVEVQSSTKKSRLWQGVTFLVNKKPYF